MVKKQFLIGLLITALGVLGVACSQTSESNVNSNANTGDTTAATTPAPDNSESTTTTDSNGVKTETRTFKNDSRVSKVVVTTGNGNRTVKVYSPKGQEKDVTKNEPPPDALHATGDAIADAAGWVKDKSETAYDKTKEGAKTAADKTVDASKIVGKNTASGAKTVANKTEQGLKKTGNAIKKVVVP
jgi:Tfp pilus assembly protein PilV